MLCSKRKMRKSRAPLSQLSCMLISALLLLYPKHRVYAYLCDSLPQENWESLVDVIQASFGGFVMLCPFEISGEGCPPEQDFPGYVVDKQENFYLMCEALYSSGSPNALHPSETGCIIDCPGTSFELRENASLTIDSFTIRGSQQTAIRIGGFASLNLFNSFMESNHNPEGKGGAISTATNSQIYISQSHFHRNHAHNGGALYTLGITQVQDSYFTENVAESLCLNEGGGAIYAGENSKVSIIDSNFMNNKASGFGPAILSHSGLDNIYVESTGCNNTADSKGLPCDGVLLAQDGIDVCESFKTICKAPPSPFPSSPPPQMALELSLLSQEPSSRPTSVSTTPGPSTEPSTGPSTEPSTEPSAVRSSPIDSVTPYPDQSALNSSPDIFSSDATSTLSPRSEAPTVVLESFEGGANSGPTNVATDMLSGTAMPTSSSVVFTQKPSIDVSSLLSNAESLSGAQQDSDFSTSEQPSSTPEPYLSTSQPSTVSYAASAEPKQTNTPIDAALDESLAMVPTFSPTQDNSSSFCPPLREPAVLSVGSYLQSSANVFVSSVTDIRMCGSILKNGSKGGWFSLLGSGEVVTASTCSLFANHVFDGDTQLLIFSADADDTKCFDGLHCVAANDDYCGKQSLISWYAQANKQYFIYVHVKSTGSIGSQFSLTLAPTPGGSCRASFELAPSPGTGSLEMNDYPSEIDFLSLGGGRWRSVTGTGDWMTASNCRGENEGEGSKMKILQGSCDNLIQTQVVETNCGIAGHSLTWLSEAGKRYFILEYDEDLDSVFRE